MIRTIQIVILSLISASCANPLNVRTADRYFQQGKHLSSQGNWSEARVAYGRALTNVAWGNLPERSKALYSFNFGRASGVICDWENAEKYLEQAYNIYAKTEPQLHYELIELAQMNDARGNYTKASEYYSKTIIEVEKHNLDKKSPMAHVDTLTRYASVESKLGNNKQSLLLKQKADLIIKNNPGKSIPAGTPYGKFCHKSPVSN